MAARAASATTLLGQAEAAWAQGAVEAAARLFERAAIVAEQDEDLETRVAAVLGLARAQRYNLTPGRLPVLLRAAHDAAGDDGVRARLAAALARCWAYANEPGRAAPYATAALQSAATCADEAVVADALDAALASHWGPDDLAARRDWAVRLGDVTAHLPDPESRLQSALWQLTVAWEVLDLPRMHRSMRAIELLAEESARARFFAASRRLPLELLRGNNDVAPLLVAQAERAAADAAIPDAVGVLHSMRGYSAYFSGDRAACAGSAAVFEHYAAEHGIAAVRAEAAVLWLGAGRLDKVAEMVGVFTPEVLRSLPRDSDWMLILQCVAEGAIAVRDREVAAGVVELLDPYAGRSVVNAGAVMWHGVTDDTLGRARALLGDDQDGARLISTALETYGRIGASWWRDRLRREEGPAGPAPAPGPAPTRVVHLRERPGGLWLVGTQGSAVLLPRMRGLQHLHVLLSNPDTDVASLDLVTCGEAAPEQAGLEVLDDTARRAYRARVIDLDRVLQRESELAPRRAAALREERAALVAELSRATGLGGRARRTGGHDERARVAVRKAIISALARLAEHDPWLARHLHERVRTGHQCRYSTDPDHPLRWVLG